MMDLIAMINIELCLYVLFAIVAMVIVIWDGRVFTRPSKKEADPLDECSCSAM